MTVKEDGMMGASGGALPLKTFQKRFTLDCCYNAAADAAALLLEERGENGTYSH